MTESTPTPTVELTLQQQLGNLQYEHRELGRRSRIRERELQESIAELTGARDDARAHAANAWAEIERLQADVERHRQDAITAVQDAAERVATLTEQRDEAREQNVILGRRLAGQVGEQLDVLFHRWKTTEHREWRTPPLSDQERRALDIALNAVGVSPDQRAGGTELLQALKILDETVGVRYLAQLQQLADDGRQGWERGHDGLRERLQVAYEELARERTRADAATTAIEPVRRRRDELIDELARVKEGNGMWAVDEIKAILKALDNQGEFPRTELGDQVHNLRGTAETAQQVLASTRAELDKLRAKPATLLGLFRQGVADGMAAANAKKEQRP